jgi:hypothetical protein
MQDREQLKKKGRWPFAGKKGKDSLSLKPQQHSASDTGSLRLYRDCSKLTLDRFLDCLFDDDLGVLIIAGNPTKDELHEAWNKIYLEYCTLMQDKTYNELFEKSKEIITLQAKISLVNGIVQHLCLSYSEELVKMLDRIGLRSKILPEDDGEVLEKKLASVVSRGKKWITQLDIQQGELQKLRKKNENGKGGREYFDDTMSILSKFMGYHVRESEISVSRFCRDVNRMNEVLLKEEMKQATN